MTVLLDPYDVGRSVAGRGLLAAFSDATVLDAADVHTAVALGRLAGGAPDAVLLAAALAVRAVRLGHVYVDLATVAATAAPEDEEVDVDVAALPWPAPDGWPEIVAASPLTAVGVDGPPDRPLRLLAPPPQLPAEGPQWAGSTAGSSATRLYLDRYWRHERTVADDLLRRSTGDPPEVDHAALAGGLNRLFPEGPGGDADQRRAAETAILRRFAVVAGGPGTGKTTTVARILALLHEQAAALGQPPPRVALAAPTGKAAARLEEAVHAEALTLDVDPSVRDALLRTDASTLHRLLGYQPGTKSRFRHDGANQLGHTAVIVDESSMVSLSLMARLLVAVRPTARLVLVGDPRQLASVEAGAVLGDIVGERPVRAQSLGTAAAAPGTAASAEAGPVAAGVVVLRQVHRYGEGIASVADAIESGDPAAVVAALRGGGPAVTWIEAGTVLDPARAPELAGVRRALVETAAAVVEAARAGDATAALTSLRQVQVLCAHRRGPGGAARWRVEIERWLRGAITGYGGGPWFAGRPLLVTENDYGLGVFNGDTGVVVDEGGGRLRAVFDRRGRILAVRPTRLASVESLYAMTIHKSQGSQFDAVVVVLPETTSRILTRELLYTAVTRARTSLTLVASEAAVTEAVTRPIARASGLGDALWPAST